MIESTPRVERLKDQLETKGYRRVILLGSEEEMCGPSIRKPLAAYGYMVFVPGAADRGLVGEALAHGAGDAAARLRAVLADGVSHGVHAIVVTSDSLKVLVDDMELGVPSIVA